MNLKLYSPQKTLHSSKLSMINLEQDMDSIESENFQKICEKYASSENNLKSFSKTSQILNLSTPKTIINDESYYRVLLSEMGYFQEDLISEISGLIMPELVQSLEDLDSINDKEVFIIPIFYLERPESSEPELLKQQKSYPNVFIDLINQMGIQLTEKYKNFDIFRSTINLLEKYGGLTITREYYYEIVSLIPALFSTNNNFALEDLLQYSQLAII